MTILLICIAVILLIAAVVIYLNRQRQQTTDMDLALAFSSVRKPSSDDRLIVVKGCAQEQLRTVLHR